MSLRPALRRFYSLVAASGSLACIVTAISTNSTQTAIANGDTRTITMVHAHTGETMSATFRVNGSYDSAVLEKLNWFLRDWRRDEPTRMDPRLFDIIWEAQRGAGSGGIIKVMSAYRSPETNSMLRRRSRAVAEHSQHTQGRAMDIHMGDVPMSAVRETAMRMQRGGVGYYPSAGSPFVHLDVGSVRAWPRMGYDQLVRLFPDQKTVHLPANGQPLARYEEARAEVEARNGSYVPTLAQVKSKSFLATLFGWEDDEDRPAPQQVARRGAPAPVRTAALAPAANGSAPAFAPAEGDSPAAFFRNDAARRGGQPATVATVAAPVVQPQPVVQPVAQSIALASLAPQSPAARAGLAPEPAPAPEFANVPMPPRRPSEAQIVGLIGAAVPLPPQRPQSLIVLAKATQVPVSAAAPTPTAKISDAGRDELAALMGASAGRVSATPGLPNVITQGAPVAASAAGGMMAFAALSGDAGNTAKAAARPARNAPVVARTVGIRAARDQRPNALFAARLDRTNFSALVAPVRIADTSISSLLGATVAPLRAAARSDMHSIMFAPPTPLEAASAPEPRAMRQAQAGASIPR